MLAEAARRGVPLSVTDLSAVPALRDLWGAGLVLVRPDQHVAWRGDAIGSPAALLDAATERLGALPSVLVNNAAHSVNGGYAEMDAAALDAHYEVNVRAPALLSCELARRHARGEPGRIVCMTSGQSLGPMLGELPYATTKAALEMFALQLAPEVMPLGLTVNVVNPGVTDTGWVTEEIRAKLLPRMPAGRIGQSEDAARLIAWLCCEDARWVTGQVIGSEGGFIR